MWEKSKEAFTPKTSSIRPVDLIQYRLVTDRRTEKNGHATIAYTAVAQRTSRGKNVAQPAFAAARRDASVCSNRSISSTRRAHSSKPAARCCGGRQTDRRADGQTDTVPFHTCRPCAHTIRAEPIGLLSVSSQYRELYTKYV